MTYGIFHDLTIQVSPDQIYKGVTSPEGLNSWWTQRATGQPKVGANYQFYFAPEYDWRAKVIRCQANELIYFEMGQSDADWEGTQLRFQLIPKAGSTLTRFEHVGWTSNNDHFRRTSYCWAIYLRGLKRYLEKGIVLPFEERSQV